MPAQVQVDGLAAFTVGAHARREIALAEGEHKARITPKGGPAEAVEFTMENSVIQRFDFNVKSVFILNVGGAAIFACQDLVYSETPQDTPKPKGKVVFGDKFIAFHTIHYAFEEPDETVQIETGTTTTRKAVFLVTLSAGEIEDRLREFGQGNRVEAFREFQARLHPGSSKMNNSKE